MHYQNSSAKGFTDFYKLSSNWKQYEAKFFFYLATPPIEDCILVYWVTYYGQLSRQYFCCSYFLTLYVKYVFIFQPDAIEGLSACKLRWKTFFWKVLLTILGICLNICVPLEEEPTVFKLLTKGAYGRYKR